MTYDFDTPVNRRNTDSLKWDVMETELPMWVADMDFQTAPEIIEAIGKRVEHGVFGYSIIPDEWYKAYQDWWNRRHHYKIEKDWLIFSTGVVPSISSIVRKLTTPNENVLIQTPVYNIFFNSIVNNGRRVLEAPLAYDGQKYYVDFDVLEEKLKDPQTTLMILCNPHNPVGMIMDQGTLKRIGELCEKHHVYVISDEIHCDLTSPDCEYTPFAAASKVCENISITCIAPTKAFNIAGLQSSAVVVANPYLRHKVWRGLNTDEVAEPNAFANAATIAAFSKGEPWLNALRQYIYDNKKMVVEDLKKELPMISVQLSEATYLLWLDCGAICENTDLLAEHIRRETGLYISAGGQFGGNGNRFLRFNTACAKSVLKDGLERLKQGIRSYTKEANK